MRTLDLYGRLSAEAGSTVTLEDVARVLGVDDRRRASRSAGALVDLGLAVRIRPGLYRLLEPPVIGTGSVAADAAAAAFALVDPEESYVGFYTAMHRHGMVRHPVRTVFVASTSRRRNREVGGVPVRFVKVIPDRIFGTERHDEVLWSDLERTIVDGFARPDLSGGTEEVVEGLARLSGRVVPGKLRSHADRYGSMSVAKRIEYCLDRLGIGGADVPGALAERRMRHPVLLDPMGPEAGEVDSRWEIRDNVGVTGDGRAGT